MYGIGVWFLELVRTCNDDLEVNLLSTLQKDRVSFDRVDEVV